MPTDTNSWIHLLLPIFTGALGFLWGKMVNWKFKKKELLRQDRKEFIKDLRATIAQKEYYKAGFIDSAVYSQIKPHLSEELIIEFETQRPRVLIQSEDESNLRTSFHHKLLDEIHILERKWGLL